MKYNLICPNKILEYGGLFQCGADYECLSILEPFIGTGDGGLLYNGGNWLVGYQHPPLPTYGYGYGDGFGDGDGYGDGSFHCR